MGEEFVKKVDQIIELLESGENSLYTYDEDKKIFKMFDKKRNINLTAKLEQDNFYFKDSISGKVYIFVKSHLNKNTTIQQILMNYGSDRYYCMYAEKNNDLELMRVVEKTQNDIMICTNTDLDNKTKDEIIKYMNETINNKPYVYREYEEVDAQEYEGWDYGKVDNELNYAQQESEYDDEQENGEYDYDQGNSEYDYDQEDSEYDYAQEDGEYEDNLESEQDSSEWDIEQEDDEYEEDNDNPKLQDEEEHNKLSDEEILEEFFSSYKVIYNNEEIEGEEKREIVLESEEILDEYYYDSLTMNNVAKVLTETLKNMQRKHEHESR